jgi:hypothetical protein
MQTLFQRMQSQSRQAHYRIERADRKREARNRAALIRAVANQYANEQRILTLETMKPAEPTSRIHELPDVLFLPASDLETTLRQANLPYALEEFVRSQHKTHFE